MLILGIETSCDETGLALYESEHGLIDHILHSQTDIHKDYGGVVPELASRDHIRKISPLTKLILANNQKKLTVYRFDMPHKFNANTLRKSIFLNCLMPFYQTEYEKKMSFGFSNYHSLNFFTSSARYPSGVPSDSGLVFPVPTKDKKPSRFFPSASFSYEFYINPRYTTDYADEVYHTGCIMHMPNSYCVSLVSGSGKDSYGRVNTFRLMFQLGFDAQVPPVDVDLSVGNDARGKRKIF